MDGFSEVIIKYASLPVLITTVYGLIVYKQLGKELRIIAWFVFLSCAVEIASDILWFQSKNNLPLLHFYVGTGFICLALFYDIVLHGFISKKIIRITLWMFVLFTIVNALFIQSPYAYASYSLTIESILIVILSLSTFILLLDELVKQSKAPLVTSLNWINSGLFIYYSSGLLLFIFGDMITGTLSRSSNNYIWSLHLLFMMIMYMCLFIALWKRPRS